MCKPLGPEELSFEANVIRKKVGKDMLIRITLKVFKITVNLQMTMPKAHTHEFNFGYLGQ